MYNYYFSYPKVLETWWEYVKAGGVTLMPCGVSVEPSCLVHNLGVSLDEELTLTTRVNLLVGRCYGQLRSIRSCRRALTRSAAVNSFIVSRCQARILILWLFASMATASDVITLIVVSARRFRLGKALSLQYKLVFYLLFSFFSLVFCMFIFVLCVYPDVIRAASIW